MKRIFAAGAVVLASLLAVLGFTSTSASAFPLPVAHITVSPNSAVQTDVAGKPVTVKVGLLPPLSDVKYTVDYDHGSFHANGPTFGNGAFGTVHFTADNTIKVGTYKFCVAYFPKEIYPPKGNGPTIQNDTVTGNNGDNNGKGNDKPLAYACATLVVTAPVTTTTPPPPTSTTTIPPVTTTVTLPGSTQTVIETVPVQVVNVPVGAPVTGFGGAHASDIGWLFAGGASLIGALVLGYFAFFRRGARVTS